jgi:hypothetical protein
MKHGDMESTEMEEWEWEDEEEPIIASEGEVTPVPFHCAACGEQNETLLDLSGGFDQQYTEDCAVCCRPNLITISVDPESYVVSIGNELEYE